jgi:hypothetical protein
MKNLDLNAYGVVEMSNAEMRETEGGLGGFARLVNEIGAWIRENCTVEAFTAHLGWPPSAGWTMTCDCKK